MLTKTKRNVCGEILESPKKWRDILGEDFGRLTALGFTGRVTKHGAKMITCQCECGAFVDVMPSSLRLGLTKSCGCLFHETVTRENKTTKVKHGATIDGKVSTLYRAWFQMRRRCEDKKSPAYKDYGGRGIKLHAPWQDFVVFQRDIVQAIGPRPTRAHSLDRINNDGDYAPGNVRWATPTEQNRNKRNTRFYTLAGEKRTLAEWAGLAGLRYETVKNRVLTYGWPLDEALGTPPGFGRCPREERKKWTWP